MVYAGILAHGTGIIGGGAGANDSATVRSFRAPGDEVRKR